MMSLFSLLGTKFAISFILDSLRPSPHSLRAAEEHAFVRSISTSNGRNVAQAIHFTNSLCFTASSLQYYQHLHHNPQREKIYHSVCMYLRQCYNYNLDRTLFPACYRWVCDLQRSEVEKKPLCFKARQNWVRTAVLCHALDICLWKYYLTSEKLRFLNYKMRVTGTLQDRRDDFKIHVCTENYIQ